MKVKLLTSILFIAVSAGSSSGQSSNEAEEVLAVIGDRIITTADLTKELAQKAPGLSTSEQRQTLLDEMVRFEMIHAAAVKAGYETKIEVLERIRRVIVDEYLRAVLYPEMAKMVVEDEEIEAYYRENQSKFTIPSKARAAVIQVSVPPKASKEKKAELRAQIESARTEALKTNPSTASFGRLAVELSDDQTTRYKGGDIGWIRAGETGSRWDGEVLDVIFALDEPGAISPVIEMSTAFLIVKLMATRDAAVRPLEAVRDQVAHEIQTAKREKAEVELYDRLEAMTKTVVYADRLKNLAGLEEPTAVPALPKSEPK